MDALTLFWDNKGGCWFTVSEATTYSHLVPMMRLSITVETLVE